MRKNPPFTRRTAAILAVLMFRVSVAAAAPPAPGTLAVLEPPMTVPEMRAAWDRIQDGIYFDPLLLVRGREEVTEALETWRQAAESVRSAIRAADRIALDRVQFLIEESRELYYRFDYEGADEVLGESRDLLLSTHGDSGFRSQLLFEASVMRGLVARALGSKRYVDDFKEAVSLDPQRELSSEQYSPETISLYLRVRKDLLGDGPVPLGIEGSPADAAVLVDGVPWSAGPDKAAREVLPGIHFIEASAPGYEPWGQSLTAQRFEPPGLRFELVPIGPEGDPEAFFLQRVKAGDRAYLSLLAEKLDVDYTLIPDPEGDVLKAWLVGRDGRTRDHLTLWESGDGEDSALPRAWALLGPLRQHGSLGQSSAGAPLAFPEAEPVVMDPVKAHPPWGRYALAIGILLMAAAAAGADRGGSTRIEATW